MTADTMYRTHPLLDLTPAATPGDARQVVQPQALPKDRILSVPRPIGRDVHCDSGCLWLTFDHDPRDVVLAAGQVHHCERNSRLTVQALDDARLRIR
jgi:hypothetical protein